MNGDFATEEVALHGLEQDLFHGRPGLGTTHLQVQALAVQAFDFQGINLVLPGEIGATETRHGEAFHGSLK
jgi:hypothetical protein